MPQAIDRYLDRVLAYAHRDAVTAAKLRAELEDHLTERVDRLEAGGTPREDAVFQAIEAHGHPRTVGYGLRPRFPLIDVRTQGTARGVIAIGPRAVGIVAFGGVAIGVLSFGLVGVGLVGIGGAILALISASGYVALAPLGFAEGGFVLGAIAAGQTELWFLFYHGLPLVLPAPNQSIHGWESFFGRHPVFGTEVWPVLRVCQIFIGNALLLAAVIFGLRERRRLRRIRGMFSTV